MFRYYHPPRNFGHRQPAVSALAGDVRYFLGAYVAGTAFALAYLF